MQINPQVPSPLSSQNGALPHRPRVPIAARGTHPTIQSIEEDVARHGSWVVPLQQEVGRVIIGQRALIERLLVGRHASGRHRRDADLQPA